VTFFPEKQKTIIFEPLKVPDSCRAFQLLEGGGWDVRDVRDTPREILAGWLEDHGHIKEAESVKRGDDWGFVYSSKLTQVVLGEYIEQLNSEIMSHLTKCHRQNVSPPPGTVSDLYTARESVLRAAFMAFQVSDLYTRRVVNIGQEGDAACPR